MPGSGHEPNLLILAPRPWCSVAAAHVFDSLDGKVRRRTVTTPKAAAAAISEGWADLVALICPTQADRHLALLRQLLDLRPQALVIAVSCEPDPAIGRRARAAGARGHLSFEHSPRELLKGIVHVVQGGTFFPEANPPPADDRPEPRALPADLDQRLDKLTRRERQVMDLLGQGYANREIAQRLGLREGTIRIYVHRVIRQLGLRNRVDVALCASRMTDRR